MSLSIDQIRKLSDAEYEEYQALDEEGKEQFEYFYGFTIHTSAPIQVQNKEVLQYQKAAQTIQLKSVAQLLDFAPHAGQQPLFYTFDAKSDVYNNFVLLLGRRAQPLDSIVSTPSGPKPFSDIAKGDVIHDPSGGLQSVTQVHDIYQGQVYKVTLSDGRSMMCDAEHLFTVTDHHGNERVLELRYIEKYYKRTRKNSHYVADNPKTAKQASKTTIEYKFKVRNPAPLHYPTSDLPIGPYILGLLLGDGAITKHATIGMQDLECIEHIANDPVMLNSKSKIYERPPGYYTLSCGAFNTSLTELGLLGTNSSTKFIPPEYLVASIEQRLDLLRGLMDTDGYHSNTGGQSYAEFSTVSKDLCDGVCKLVRSLGGTVSVGTKYGSYKKNNIRVMCKKVYRVNIRMELCPFKIERKAKGWKCRKLYNYITDISYVGEQPVRCISVSSDHQTYITDDYVVTHNTGKSEVTSVVAIREMFLPHSSTVLLTPVFENAKIIFLNVLKKINQLGMPIKTINKGSFRIELENGARFSAASAANVESVLGSSNSLIICDETQSIPDVKRILNQMLVPTLLDYGIRDSGILWAHQIILGTPRGEENELTDYYYNELTMKNWKSFTAPSTSNPTLPTAYIEQMRLELGDLLYRQEILAEIIGSDENVFYAFDREQNTYDPDELMVNEHSEIICGIDIGWGDSTANVMIYRQPDGSYYVHQAYSQNHTTTENHVKNYRKLEEQLVGKVDVRYCDPAAAQTINDYIETYNYDVMAAKNDVKPSLQYINQLFAPSGINKKPKLYINKELTELIRQVSRIRNKPNTSKASKDPFIKDPEGTHWDLIAALRYALFSDQFNNAALNIIT